MSNYTLEVISHHPKFKNSPLRKYYVDGIDTIGAWEEPFEIRFKNHTWQKVQVKLSLDGTDILTGKLADTNVSENMWIVNGNDTLSIKAWQETNNGGAAFVFTSANNSIAVHTHGNLSSRGIIAAAVFTEGHVEPIKLSPPVQIKWPYPVYPYNPYYYSDDIIRDTISFNCDASQYKSSNVSNTCDNFTEVAASNFVSVGAGEHVDQKITYAAGLIKPMLTETIRIKYLWWDDLVEKLRAETTPVAHASGFPGDKNKNIYLGKTPRIKNKNTLVRSDKQSNFSRV